MSEVPPQVTAQQAREFATPFVPDPKVFDGMAEPDVLAYHGRVKGAIDTHVQEAIKARGDFSPEWRKALAGEDADELKRLERFQTPKDLHKSYRELATKLSKGELKSVAPYPEKGTDEQKALWRTEQGIPDTPEGYKVELKQGQVLGDDDKPIVDSYLKYAHEHNITPGLVNANVQWFLDHREEAAATNAENIKVQERDTEDALREDWGTENYRGKMNNIQGLLDATITDETMKKAFGNSIKRNVEFAKWIDGIAFQLNPHGVLVGHDHASQAKSIEDEIGKFEKMMKENRTEYNKEANQTRYRALLEERDRLANQAKKVA